MRASFKKYMKENETKREVLTISSVKKYSIGFILGLFFVGTISYANTGANGTIGKLFNFLGGAILENGSPVNNVYRLDGRNIEDGTVTSYELSDNSVGTQHIIDGGIKTNDIGNFQVTKNKLSPNSVDNTKVVNIHGRKILPDTIGEREISDVFKARNSSRSDFSNRSQYADISQNTNTLNGRYSTWYLQNNHYTIPTSKAVKDYVDRYSLNTEKSRCYAQGGGTYEDLINGAEASECNRLGQIACALVSNCSIEYQYSWVASTGGYDGCVWKCKYNR